MTKETIEAFMRDYIKTTVMRYKGKFYVRDVINEVIADSGTNEIRASPYAKVDDFVCKAFKWAISADP